MTIRGIARTLNVSAPSVLKWIKENAIELPESQEKCYIPEVEVDEMWHYLESKKYTHAIERHKCRNRHWLARLTRKKIAFSRSQSMVEYTMKLLAYYRFKHPEKLEQLKTFLN
jgi:hypothetical protein